MKTKYAYAGTVARTILIASLLFSACKKDDDVKPPPQYTMEELYAHSIKDAMVDDGKESIDTLWAITPENTGLQWKTINGKKYVLVGTFTRFFSSYPVGDSVTNTWGTIWIFIPQQMKRRLLPVFTPTTDTILRISQLLGLPPVNKTSDTHIAQMWVEAERLFRPAGNPAINTTTTGSVLVEGVPPAYSTWFDSNIIYSYYRPLQSATDYYYPWTRLGYTYDWNPDAKKVGLSEYVLQGNSGIWVESVSTASQYFRN